MKTIKDLEKEFRNSITNMTDTCSVKFALAFTRKAIQTAFEATRVESDDNYKLGEDGKKSEIFCDCFGHALSEVAKRQEEFLNN